MTKLFKTVTVNQLHKMMARLIDKGHSRRQVCVNKSTFSHNCENDGVLILGVDGCQIETIPWWNNDTDDSLNADGSERTRTVAVLFGSRGTGFKSILSEQSVEEYINRELVGYDEGEAIRKFAEQLRDRTGVTVSPK